MVACGRRCGQWRSTRRPNTPGFLSFERTARHSTRSGALGADRLGTGDVDDVVGEEQGVSVPLPSAHRATGVLRAMHRGSKSMVVMVCPVRCGGFGVGPESEESGRKTKKAAGSEPGGLGEVTSTSGYVDLGARCRAADLVHIVGTARMPSNVEAAGDASGVACRAKYVQEADGLAQVPLTTWNDPCQARPIAPSSARGRAGTPERCVFVRVQIIGILVRGAAGWSVGPSCRAETAQRELHNHAATVAVKEVSRLSRPRRSR